jgi:hypothetical protein
MTFATLPLWLVLGIAGATTAAVVALYLLRRTPRPQIVSNVDFWIEAMHKARPRVLSSTRIPLVSLLVTLLVALLLVTEIGGPRFGEGVRGTTVLVLAAGSSMGAEEAGASRLRRALDEVESWTERATASGEVAVVRAGIRPSVLMPVTDDEADLDRALKDFGIDDGPADLAGAVRLADAIVRERGGNGQILLVADRVPESDTATPVVLVPVGGTADTLAITALTARRDPIAVGEYVVQVEVASFTSRRSRTRLTVRDRDVTIFDQRVELGPGERQRFEAQGFSSAQGELVARLEETEIAGSEDALASDDVAYAIAPALAETKVLLATAGNRWLETVLAAHGALDVTKVGPDEVSSLTADELGAHDVVILDRVTLEAPLPHAGVMVVGATGAQGVGTGERLTRPRVRATLASHEALGGVRLESVRFLAATALSPEPRDHVLMRDGRHALAIARERSGQRVVALGFDLESTDLVERVAFPLFMHHAITWLAGHRDTTLLSSAPGVALEVVEGATVLDPEDDAASTFAGRVEDTSRAGIYHVGERAVAISGAEAATPLPAPAPTAAPRGAGALPPLAVILAALLLIVMLAEWALLHRGRLS